MGLSAFGDSMIWFALKLSLLVTLVATCVVVLLGTAFAFVLAKRKFRARIGRVLRNAHARRKHPGQNQTMPLAIYEAVVAGEDPQAQILALILTAAPVTENIGYPPHAIVEARKF
jgi:ABC-type molybdate transport system permease subunit